MANDYFHDGQWDHDSSNSIFNGKIYDETIIHYSHEWIHNWYIVCCYCFCLYHTHYWQNHSVNRRGDYDAFNAIRLFINVTCEKLWHGNGACWTGHFIRTCYWANDIWMDYYILFLENDILHHAAYWYFRNFNRT